MKAPMNKASIFFRIIAFSAVIVLILTGCASILHGVNIRTVNNISSVRAGGTLDLRSSGRDIVWSVSSGSDGSGVVAAGTFINQNGLLTVAANETASVLYVTARSARDGFSNTRQIRIVTVTGVTITPVNQTVAIGSSLQFRAQVLGSNNPDSVVTWRVSSNAAGTGNVTNRTSINTNGVLTVAPNESARTLFVFATSVIDPTKSVSTSVSVVVPTVTSVIVNPATLTERAGNFLQFQAFVTGTHNPNPAVTWNVSSNPAGSGAVTPGTNIDINGVLTIAPNETARTLFIIATSVYDPSKSGNAVVSVIIPTVASVIVNPANHTIRTGSFLQFQAFVTGTHNPNPAVIWRVSSNAAGSGAVTPGTSINANGLLTVAANETARTLFVFATSLINPTRSGSAVVTIINNNPN